MAMPDRCENPYRRIARRHWLLIGAGFASPFLGFALAAQLPRSEHMQALFALTGIAFFAGFTISSMVVTRCPYCRWMLLLTQTKWGMPWSHPWPDKVCSNCKRDLTASLDETFRH